MKNVGHWLRISEQALVDEFGPGVPDPDCLRCDIAQVHRVVEQGARYRAISGHDVVMAAAQVGAAEYASVLQDMRRAAEEGLPARACAYHLIPAQQVEGSLLGRFL